MIEDGIFEGESCLIRKEGWRDRWPVKRSRKEGRKGSERLYIIYLLGRRFRKKGRNGELVTQGDAQRLVV